ncbi:MULTISPECIES: helix-turn-helix domain-containing protein [unclassified Marinimicrobium]|uniref:helix-turn-helix domain-containing protein n=1 Tax=unclassified Marinimicrobium TaxID=2632100 RepID=UPI00257ADCA8|nr:MULTISPECIES: helix-turn-helix domain-containing protein [unclassified Marinimicrobium]
MNFSDCLQRLKHELRVSTDKEVAEALGLSKTAFAERKRRGAFPIDKTRVLCALKPELDEVFILTGRRLSGEERHRVLVALDMSADLEAEEEGELLNSLTKGVAEEPGHYGGEVDQVARIKEALHRCSGEDLDVLETLANRLARNSRRQA